MCGCPSASGLGLCYVMVNVGEVLLSHAWDLPEPQHHEIHPRECWRKVAGQTAVLPEDHGA